MEAAPRYIKVAYIYNCHDKPTCAWRRDVISSWKNDVVDIRNDKCGNIVMEYKYSYQNYSLSRGRIDLHNKSAINISSVFNYEKRR